MRSYEEYKQILDLWQRGYKQTWIEYETGIPRATVRDAIKRFKDLEGLDAYFDTRGGGKFFKRELSPQEWTDIERKTYSYLLAVYLGDGCITLTRSTHRLRVAMDSIYPNIIAEVKDAMQMFAPSNSVSIVRVKNSRGIEVACYSNTWVKLFPQHGAGVKHSRKIELEAWQREIMHEYPIEFLRGLIHTDGTRINPVINGKVYSRYQFSQVSTDIRALFEEVCGVLNLNWTFWGVIYTIARRKDVEYLDTVIGAKT